MSISRFFAIVGPGLLVAATGVGMGDLATGSFAGSMLGVAILWAVLLGAFLKFIVTEGIARWQLASGQSVIEGMAARLGPIPLYLFLPYLLLWSFFTATAMMSGCGVTLHALIPVFDDPRTGKIVFGIISSLIGTVMVYYGGYRLFEKIMTACILLMFATVVVTAFALWPGTGVIMSGLLVPTIPDVSGEGFTWTVALIGGVGGTVSVLSYGYWIREEGRTDPSQIGICRLDLGTGYLMTAIFGMAVIIIGSNVEVSGSGADLVVALADQLQQPLGQFARWAFLIGVTGAVFSSLLGVWQATPYYFSDCWRLVRGRPDEEVSVNSKIYKWYLAALAIIPMLGLFVSFREAYKIYAVIGAFFVPVLALLLLLLNSRSDWVGKENRNGIAASVSLAATIAFFLWIAVSRLLA